MNAQSGSTSNRRIVCGTVVAAILLASAASRSIAQTSVVKPEPRLDVVAPLPARRTIPILGARDSSTFLDPLGGILQTRPPRPTVRERGRAARITQDIEHISHEIDYSGPRFGVTYLPKAAVDSLKKHNIQVGTTITQFGWQLEREIHVSPEGPRVLNELVFLAGGLESGVFLPSLTWLIGARDKTGNEIGVGPNASVAGVGLAAAAGVTVHDGGVNFPMNIAVAKSKTGARVSFMTGFTIH